MRMVPTIAILVVTEAPLFGVGWPHDVNVYCVLDFVWDCAVAAIPSSDEPWIVRLFWSQLEYDDTPGLREYAVTYHIVVIGVNIARGCLDIVYCKDATVWHPSLFSVHD